MSALFQLFQLKAMLKKKKISHNHLDEGLGAIEDYIMEFLKHLKIG